MMSTRSRRSMIVAAGAGLLILVAALAIAPRLTSHPTVHTETMPAPPANHAELSAPPPATVPTFAPTFRPPSADLSAAPRLQVVSPQALAIEGYTFSRPLRAPTVGWRAAVEAAVRAWVNPVSQVREVVLARVTDAGHTMLQDKLCWVVSIMPAGGLETIAPRDWTNPQHPVPEREDFLLYFVDALTGRPILWMMGPSNP